jgi:hypothetical protein
LCAITIDKECFICQPEKLEPDPPPVSALKRMTYLLSPAINFRAIKRCIGKSEKK